jgi:hypothetical protein
MFIELLENANRYAGILGALVGGIPVVWSVLQYLSQKRHDLKNERFEIYHRLIKQLVEREDKEKPMMLDRQLAVVFELRRFTEYYESSLRILMGLQKGWGAGLWPKG